MGMVVQHNCFIDFDTILFLVFCPEKNKEHFDLRWLEEKLAVVTPKEDMGVRFIWDDVASGNHSMESIKGKRIIFQ